MKKILLFVIDKCKQFIYNRGYFAGDCEGYRDGILNRDPDPPLPLGPGAFSRGIRDGYDDGWNDAREEVEEKLLDNK